jgi:hypothetical protein
MVRPQPRVEVVGNRDEVEARLLRTSGLRKELVRPVQLAHEAVAEGGHAVALPRGPSHVTGGAVCDTRRVREDAQLAALRSIHQLLDAHEIEYWLFGGWAVDFHAKKVSRPHDDIDLAVWSEDRDRIAALLATDGWSHAPEEGEDGYTGYERDDVRLELAFLARDTNRDIYTPLKEGRGNWPEGSFGGDVAELRGVRARVSSLRALKADKSEAHNDPRVAMKDHADLATLAASHQSNSLRRRSSPAA